jgi:acetoin:2,6-dichlorophenolindophenol oxidoreductase subunit alpha
LATGTTTDGNRFVRPSCGRRDRRGAFPHVVRECRQRGLHTFPSLVSHYMNEEAINGDTQLWWFEQMLGIRTFEEKVQELFMEGLVQGTTHLCQGQEAVAVGSLAALGADDYLTITYRGHGHAIARGLSMEACFAELMGRRDGCCHGVGGSMHFTDVSKGLLGAFAIIGAGLSVALGAAMSAKLRGTTSVAMGFCGDGATNIGTFHEALNMASVWDAPVVFVVENNLYAEYSPLAETTAVTDLANRGASYGMRSEIVDGQDVEAVFRAATRAVEHARLGEGPTLLEMKTYRFRGHSRTDPAKYRPDGELDRWKLRDPLTILGTRLAERELLDESEQRSLLETITSQVDEAAKCATQSPVSTLEELKAYVYA